MRVAVENEHGWSEHSQLSFVTQRKFGFVHKEQLSRLVSGFFRSEHRKHYAAALEALVVEYARYVLLTEGAQLQFTWCVVGEAGVGKTAVVHRLARDAFVDSRSCAGELCLTRAAARCARRVAQGV